jgi:inosose dehydratase
MAMLSSFVPVPIANPSAKETVIAHVCRGRKAASGFRRGLAGFGRQPNSKAETTRWPRPVGWKRIFDERAVEKCGVIIAEVERAAAEFGLKLVFHPDVATYVETPQEVARLFDSIGSTDVGLCLDTGHCVYGGGDPVEEAQKYRSLLRYVHIKDINARVLDESRRSKFAFEQAVGAGVFSSIGEGCIDFLGFLRLLETNQYSGWMVVEQDVIYGKTKIPPVDRMRGSLTYLKNTMAQL